MENEHPIQFSIAKDCIYILWKYLEKRPYDTIGLIKSLKFIDRELEKTCMHSVQQTTQVTPILKLVEVVFMLNFYYFNKISFSYYYWSSFVTKV